MMRTLVLAAMAALMLPGPLAAQNPGMRRQMLQQQVVERFLTNYRVQAGLTDEQFEKVKEASRRAFEARAALAERERETLRALEAEMRPGVAADEGKVVSLLDRLVQIQADRAVEARKEQDEYATFLDPVQRAQLTLAWARLQMQIERVRAGQGGPRMQGP
jgi:Spy/CpxP family protein refolding chaperone